MSRVIARQVRTAANSLESFAVRTLMSPWMPTLSPAMLSIAQIRGAVRLHSPNGLPLGAPPVLHRSGRESRPSTITIMEDARACSITSSSSTTPSWVMPVNSTISLATTMAFTRSASTMIWVPVSVRPTSSTSSIHNRQTL